jgi:predicted transcriptional regulator
MFIKDLYVEKPLVITTNKERTIEEVLTTFKESGYRCIPVIDEMGNYEGMIYKIHLKEYVYEEDGDKNETIEKLIKHQNEYINENSSFVEALSKIKAIPFIAVVKDMKLIGILTHSKVMGVIEDALGKTTGGFNITISTLEATGMIEKLMKILKNENIEGLFTLDNGSKLMRRVVLTINKNKSIKELEDLQIKIEKAGFRVLHIDYLH